MSATPASFVVRTPNGWAISAGPSDEPTPCGLADVIATMGHAAPAPVRSGPAWSASPSLSASTFVSGAWMFAGLITAHGVVVDGPDGAQRLLDGADLALLDEIGVGSTLSEIAAADPSRSRRIAELVAAGLLVEGQREPSRPSPDAPAVDVPIPRPAAASSAIDQRAPDDPQLIPVVAPWQRSVGPMLSLGMLCAAARHHDDGALTTRFAIHRPEPSEDVLEFLTRRRGPAVLLASDYVWSVDHNLDLARSVRRSNDELVVIHGGPSCPGYAGDAEAFLRANADVAHVLVHGEGERTLCEVLDAVAPDGRVDPARLATVKGISFLDPSTGSVVRTEDRPRISTLDELPSPYLTGEFDHIDPSAWHYCVSIETNRGCPYGCTFCDWGSSTMSRIRMFDIERVHHEVEWASRRGIIGVQLCDANFGITSRDVEIAERIARISRAGAGVPSVVALTPAKNTTKHLPRIFDHLTDAGITMSTAISLQTVDGPTLDAVERSNISTDAYIALAADLRSRGQMLQGDLLLGMPGQTYDSYRRDLQFFMDHDIVPRTWHLQLLPNAPMNEPGYRERFAIRADPHGIVESTSTMTPEDRERMRRLRKIQVITWRFGILKHLFQYLQWEHDLLASDLMERLAETTEERPGAYPLITWLLENFDVAMVPPVGWPAFYREVRRFVADELGVAWRDTHECVIGVQQFVMPAAGRRFPAMIELEFDYPSYLQDALIPLMTTGIPAAPLRPLSDYPSGRLVIEGDERGLGDHGAHFVGDSRDEVIEGNFWIEVGFEYQLPSSVRRITFPDLAGRADPAELRPKLLEPPTAGIRHPDSARSVPVSLGSRGTPG